MSSAKSNLSALAEDDDEEEEEDEPEVLSSEESENEGENEGENGPLKEPNKFDVLCDGVVNSMAIVQTAIQELLGLKDEILQHTLPPAVLIKFATVCGRVFRSVSDQSKPVNELVRMVHVYSTPWEEKSAALKKLHDDYENKQRQLNIAIKRLQLVDAHSKRIAREKRIMNWEKLFAKVTTSKGHGRRWKFLIETIKQKAKMGYEHVQEYTRSLEESTDSESEEEEDTLVALQSVHDVTSTGPITTSVTPSEKPDSEVVIEDDDDDSSDKEDDNQGGLVQSGTTPIGDILQSGTTPIGDILQSGTTPIGDILQSGTTPIGDILNTAVQVEDIDEEDALESVESMEDIESGHVSPKKVRFGEGEITIIKPEVKDNSTWTDETEYKEYLYVRVFKPVGLEQHELKCSLTYGNQMFKTGVLDLKSQEVEEEPKSPTRPPAAGRHHGRTSRSPLVEQPLPKQHGRYEEFMLNIDTPTNLPGETIKPLQFAIQHGQFEEIVAMAAVDVTDLKQLDLKTVYLPPVKGDDDVLKEEDDDLDSLSDSIDIPINDTASVTSEKSLVVKDETLKYVDPIPFPLFPLKTGRSSISTPGSLPLIFYWGKRPQPKTFNRQIGTIGVKELVYDLTGIDLHTTTKEDLNKEMRDNACSAILFTPEPTEDTVLKSDYETLQNKHESEIQVLQTKYETRLQELMDNMNSMVEQQKHQQQKVKSPKATPRQVSNISCSTDSAKSNRSVKIQPVAQSSPSPVKSSSPIDVVFDPAIQSPVKSVPTPPKYRTRPLPPPTRVNKNFLVGKPNPKWGENLPQDFFERLKLFEEESRLRKQELNEKTLEEIKHNLEQKLAGQHKLSKREEQMYDALKDVSLPALFMPYKTGNVYNPRAHQYFHPTGSQDMRLTQPPSVFQLPPLKAGDKMSVLNLFDLSRNFQRPKESWLMEKYIEQQHPVEYPGLMTSSDRTGSGFKSSSGPQLPLDSKCSNSITDRQQQPDNSRHDQQVQA